MNGLHLTDRRQRGQAIVLVALMAVALVAFVGLALDGAQVFERRRQMQNAADAGSMAGAYGLSVAQAGGVIAGQVQKYTVGGGGIGNRADAWDGVFLPSNNNVKTTDPAASDNCVLVTSTVSFNTYFVGVIGFDTLGATARAKACTGPVVSSGAPMWPVLVHTPTVPYAYGQVITLYNDSAMTYTSGTFGWANFNGAQAAGDLIPQLYGSYSGTYDIYGNVPAGSYCPNTNVTFSPKPFGVTIGDCISAGPGIKPSGHKYDPTACAKFGWNSSVECAIGYHLNMSVTVLIYDTSIGTGSNGRYRVTDFGRFTLTDFNLNGVGHEQYIVGYFQRYVLPGEICLTGCNSTSGVKGVNLIN